MKIFNYVPDIEHSVMWRGAFTEEDLQTIDTIGEYAEFTKGVVGSEDQREDLDYRDVDVTWIRPDEDNIWLFKKINELVAKINFDKFQLDLDLFEGLQLSKYKSEEKGHYDWHTDSSSKLDAGGNVRKLSIILMLSKPEDYEGGKLLFNLSGNQDSYTEMELNRGDILIFYSHIPHKVCDVTAGERRTLVTWVSGPKLR
jgi:PKHD-type hydroxylase